MLLVVLAAAVMVGLTEAATTEAPAEPARCCFDKEFSAVLGELGGTVNPATGDLEYIDVSDRLHFVTIDSAIVLACVHTRTHTHTHARTHANKHTNTHTHTRAHTHTHTLTHTHLSLIHI